MPTATDAWDAVEAARAGWRTAESEITRAATIQGELAALAAAADRDAPGEPGATLAALAQFGDGTKTETTADRRAALSYATAAVLDGQDAIAAFSADTTVGPEVDAVVRTLRSFLDGASWAPVERTVEAIVARPETGWTPADRTSLSQLATLFDRLTDAAVRVRDRHVAELNDALRTAYAEAGDPIANLEEQPVALLPVRVETRFVDPDDGVGVTESTLRLRVFHDQLHVDTHEPELTRAEERWAKNFWTMLWVAAHPDPASLQTADSTNRVRARLGSDRLYDIVTDIDLDGFSATWRERYDELKERAWRQILDRYGRERGAYIVHTTAPGEAVATQLLRGPPKPPEPDDDDDSPRFELSAWGERDDTAATDAGSTDLRDRIKARETYQEWFLETTYVDDHSGDRTASETRYDREIAASAAAYDEPALEFPTVPRRSGQWTRAARAALLPDRFVAVVHWTDGDDTEHRYVQAGDPVQEPLPVGPSAESAATAESEDGTAPSGLEWMTDFAEAERAGMALSVPLSKLDGFDGKVDRVVVLGVKTSLSARDTPSALRDLLEAHHYTDGLSFVEQGTPTNATRAADATAGDDALTSLPVELDVPLVTTGDKSDGDLLARALGIEDPDEERPHVFGHVAGADATAQRDARHVNTALWPATMGYSLTHLLVSNAYTENPSLWGADGDEAVPKSRWHDGLDEPLAWLDSYRRHFVRYVRGEGPFPTLRVGRQPYGVLPATAIEPEPVSAAIPPDILADLADGTLRLPDAIRETGVPLEHFVDAVDTAVLLDAGGDPGDLYRAGADADSLATSVDPSRLRKAGVPGRDLLAAGVDSSALRSAGYDAAVVDDATAAVESGDEGGQRRAKRARKYAVAVNEPADRAESEQYAFPFDPVTPLRTRRFKPTKLDDDELADGGTATVERIRTSGRDDELPSHLASYVRRLRSVWDEAADTLPETLDEETLIETLKREAVSSVVRREHEYFPAEVGGDDPAPLSQLVQGLIDDRKETLREDLRWANLEEFDPRLAYLAQLDRTDPDVILPADVVDTQVDRFVEILLDLPVAELAQLSWDLDPDALPIDPAALDMTRADWDAKDTDAKRRAIVGAIERSDDPYDLYNDIFLENEKAEEGPKGEASQARLFSMVRLQATYGEPGLLSTLIRLLVHYGLLHAYLNARVRLGMAYGDPPSVGPDPGSYRPWDRTMFDELFDDAPQSLIAHPDLTGDESYADALRMAAADYETTTSIDPQLSEHSDSLRYLAEMDPQDLADQLFSTLDLSNHRLDAWWTSLATKRLFELRTAQAQFADEDRPLNWVTGEGRGEGDRVRADRDQSDVLRATTQPELLWTVARALGEKTTPLVTPDGEKRERTVGGTAVSIDDALGVSLGASEPGAVLREDGELAIDLSDLGEHLAVPPTGLYVGAYGYVEHLTREERGVAATPEYIHTPSEQQATTAALLRAGYRAFADGDGGDALAVDLSADRIREGLRLLRGVRRGQSLGELLGYRLERRLREVTVESWDDPPLGRDASDDTGDDNLVKYLPALRTLFPAGSRRLANEGESAAELARQAVVDGYRVTRDWADYHSADPEKTYPELGADVRPLPGPETPNGRALQRLVDELVAAVDAVGDLLTAESVHQLGQGNFSAAAGSIEALARGEQLPDPTVVDIPRTETGIGHRQFLALDPEETGTRSPDGSVRASAEPALDAWLADMLAPLSSVGCRAEFVWTDPNDDPSVETEQSRTVSVETTLDALDLAPLDVLAATSESAAGERTELEERLGYHLRRERPPAVPADADLRLFPTESGAAPLAVADLLELAGTLRDLVGEARPLEPADLQHPDDQSGPDPADQQRTADTLAGRADATATRLAAVRTALDERLALLIPDDDDRAALRAAAETGTSTPPTGTDHAALSVPPVTRQVDALANALDSFDDRVDHDTVAAQTSALQGETVRSELADLLATVPAGPTEAEATPETVRIEAATAQVLTGSLFDPASLASVGSRPRPSAPTSSVVTLDRAGTLAASDPSLPTPTYEGTGLGSSSTDPAGATVHVEVWGTDGTDWIQRATTVTADDNGVFEAPFDFTDVTPGTPLTVAASVDGETVYTAKARIVSATDDGPEAASTALQTAPTLLGSLWLDRQRPGLDVAGGAAADLETALADVDWTVVAREHAAMDSMGVLSAADIDTVANLEALESVSVAALDDALQTALGAAAGVGLLTAFDVDPNASSPTDADVWFTGGTDSHRFRAAIDHAATNPAAAVASVDRSLWAYAPGVAVALDGLSEPAHAAAAIEALLSVPGWAITELSAAVHQPHALLRDLTAWLYHPAAFGGVHTSLATRLSTLAGNLGGLDYLDTVLADLPRASGERPRDALSTHLSAVASVVETGPHAAPDAATATATFDQQQRNHASAAATTAQEVTTNVTAAVDGRRFDHPFRNGVLEPLRRTLLDAAAFGAYASVPVSADGGAPADEHALVAQALASSAALAARHRSEQALVDARASGPAVPPVQAIEDAIDRLHILLGDSFTVLPPFTPVNATELTSTFGDSDLVPEGATQAPETWLQRVAQVRDRAATFRDAYSYAEALGGTLKRTLAVGQLPARADDIWVGVEPPHRGDVPFERGTVSLIAGLGPGVTHTAFSGRLAGLFLDEWVDSIPAETETTGVAIEYDDPGARAPQSILLAVPPDDGEWSLRDLSRTVVETMDYARLRAVDLGDVERLDAILPGLFLANNHSPKPKTPSVDLDMLDRYDHEMVVALVMQTLYAVPYEPETGGDNA